VELLIGCGSTRERRLAVNGRREWTDLKTLDNNADHRPDYLHNLNHIPYPFESDTFEEVHGYEILEHLGRQGDYLSFFTQFSELWRILKPGGFLAATCPSYRSMWAWGDPSHTRVLTSGTLVFLDQEQYALQVGRTPMSDFRFCYKADFKAVWVKEDADTFCFVLQAVKPARLDMAPALSAISPQT